MQAQWPHFFRETDRNHQFPRLSQLRWLRVDTRLQAVVNQPQLLVRQHIVYSNCLLWQAHLAIWLQSLKSMIIELRRQVFAGCDVHAPVCWEYSACQRVCMSLSVSGILCVWALGSLSFGCLCARTVVACVLSKLSLLCVCVFASVCVCVCVVFVCVYVSLNEQQASPGWGLGAAGLPPKQPEQPKPAKLPNSTPDKYSHSLFLFLPHTCAGA